MSQLRRVAWTALAIESALITCLSPSINAQSSERTPQFRSDVTLSTIEVSVFNRDGTAITGLEEEDFILLEDKKPRKIEKVLEFGNSAAGLPPSDLRLRESATQPDGRRAVVILLDDSQIEPNPTVTARVKQIAAAIVTSLQQADYAAVLFTGNTRGSVDFTFDRSRLIDAVNSFRARSSGTPSVSSEADLRARSTLSMLEAVIGQIGQVAQGRKSIFYVSTGVNLPRETTQNYAMILQRMQRLFAAAERSNVTIYTVDPGGLGSGPGTSIAESAIAGPGRITGRLSRHDFLRMLADNTGGQAVVDTNSPSQLAQRAVVASRHYYLIAYEASDRINARHRLSVRVHSSRAIVRFRATDSLSHGP